MSIGTRRRCAGWAWALVLLVLGCGACEEAAYRTLRGATTTKPDRETDAHFLGHRPPPTQTGPTVSKSSGSTANVVTPSSGPRTGTVVARHILIQWKGCAGASTTRTRAEAARIADEVSNRLHRGEDFATVASAVSDDLATASRGGDLGAFTGGTFDATFEGRAFSLEPGELSDAFETDAGYEIVQRTK